MAERGTCFPLPQPEFCDYMEHSKAPHLEKASFLSKEWDVSARTVAYICFLKRLTQSQRAWL